MDLEKAWQQQQEKEPLSSFNKTEIMEAIRQESISTIQQLKTGLQHKLNWIIFFLVLLTVGIIYFIKQPIIAALFFGGWLVYFVGFLSLRKQIQRITTVEDSSGKPIDWLRYNLAVVQDVLKGESRWGYVSFPIIAFFAMLMGSLFSGADITELLTTGSWWLKYVLLTTMGVFGVNWLGGRMNNYAYGAFIEKLKNNIRQLEELAV